MFNNWLTKMFLYCRIDSHEPMRVGSSTSNPKDLNRTHHDPLATRGAGPSLHPLGCELPEMGWCLFSREPQFPQFGRGKSGPPAPTCREDYMPTYPFSTYTLHTHVLVPFRHSNKDTHYLRHVMHIFWTHTQLSPSQTTPHTTTCQPLPYYAWTSLHEYITSDTPHTYFASNYISYTSIFHRPNHHTIKPTHAYTPETSSHTSYMRTPYQIPVTPHSRHFTHQWISHSIHHTSHPE